MALKKGVLIFQMPVDRINSIMGFNGKYEEAGLGSSGESYLVGKDFKMRNNSRFVKDIKDPVIQKLGSTIGVWKIETDSTRAVLSENVTDGKWVIDDYRGIAVLSVYNSVDLFGQAKWAIIAEIDESEALQPAIALRNIIIIAAVAILIAGLIIFVFCINSLVGRPLSRLNEGVLNLLNSEDTSSRVDLKSNDEIGKIAANFNIYLQKIEDGIQEDKNVIDNVSSVVTEVSLGSLSKRVTATTSNNTVQKLVDELNNMMTSLQETIKHSLDTLESYQKHDYRVQTSMKCTGEICELMQGIDDLGSSISKMLVENTQNGNMLDNSAQVLLKNIDSLNKESTDASANLEETAAALEEINSSIGENTNNIVKMTDYSKKLRVSSHKGQEMANKTTLAIGEIDEQVKLITDAIGVIDQIAFQTNVLSLNAAVEAASAGESGRGFAVVAQEVRNLSTRSAEAAKEIKGLVENAKEKANEGKAISNDMIEDYKKLNSDIEANFTLIGDIEHASKEQANAIAQINDAVNSLDQQTQRNVVIVNNTYDISIETSNMAVKITEDTANKEFLGKGDIILPSNIEDVNSNEAKLVVKQANDNAYVSKKEDESWESF